MSKINRRINILSKHLSSTEQKTTLNHHKTSSEQTTPKSESTLSEENHHLIVTDSKTGKQIKIPIQKQAIDAIEFKKFGIQVFDPGFRNTAIAESKITYTDGANGILRYRGYPIEVLAEKSTFIEVSYLLINGELPSKKQLKFWNDRIMKHTYLHQSLVKLLKTFRYDAHPMGMIISTLSALSTFYPAANPALQGGGLYIKGGDSIINKQIFRILGKLPTIAACSYRNRIGKPYNNPKSELGYTENFLYMLDRLSENNYKPDPKLSRILDVLFIIHADHELNCSTAAMRHISSARTDPYTSMAGAAGALYGPKHGGACEAVLHMLTKIKKKENVPSFIEKVKAKKETLMGFGHRIYKSMDPRAKIVKKLAYEAFELLGYEPMIEIALALEKEALSDDYFKKRNLYPNVDFYTGLIYRAMGFTTDMFPVLFLIPRAAGWLAHWVESMKDKEQSIFRPRQVYIGEPLRKYKPLNLREEVESRSLDSFISATSRRRNIEQI